MDDKTEFLTKLGGPKAYKKALDDLFRQRRLINLEIKEMLQDAYLSDPVIRNTPVEDLNQKYHKAIFQLSIIFESECEHSPYGMHAVSNAHQHHDHCVWCTLYVGGWENERERI